MWPNFDFQNNYFTIYLSQHFDIELNPKPDFLIHSVYSKNYLKFNCYKICITGEDTRPNFSESDFHIGFDYNDSPRYLRWPLFLMNKYSPDYLIEEKDVNLIFKKKQRFCSFVVSNSYANERINFFNKLSEYKRVDSGGKCLNNIGSPVVDKFEFISKSKFNIAFENYSSSGYTTEKIFDAFIANCIPIYWGNPCVEADFNEKAFINVHKYNSIDEVIAYIKYLDRNDDVYKSVLSEPAFLDNKVPEQFQLKKFVEFFAFIFEQSNQKKKVYKFAHKGIYLWYHIKAELNRYKAKLARFKNSLLSKVS
ncbi:glycosyltransferase [Pontibacter sp. SGAir0037]|nr:glycosyltransferase [Pontibacter sp. SGAir0037]